MIGPKTKVAIGILLVVAAIVVVLLPRPAALLRKSMGKYATLSSYHDSGNVTVSGISLGNKGSIEMCSFETWLARPELLHFEWSTSQGPGSGALWITGEGNFLYDKKGNKLEKVSLKRLLGRVGNRPDTWFAMVMPGMFFKWNFPAGPMGNLVSQLAARGRKLSFLRDERIAGLNCRVITGRLETDMSFDENGTRGTVGWELVLWIARKDSLIRQARIIPRVVFRGRPDPRLQSQMEASPAFTITFSEVTINPPLSDTDFAHPAPSSPGPSEP